MNYDFTPDQIAWRDQVRDFLAVHASPELVMESLESGNEGQGPHS